MFDFSVWLYGLGASVVLLTLVWVVSVKKRDASIIDPFWPLVFALSWFVYRFTSDVPHGTRHTLVTVLLLVWSLRLAGHLFKRWNEPEDRRYTAMRERQGAHFARKSLFTIYWVQALLAWVVSLPLLANALATTSLGVLDAAGVAFFVVGFLFEAIGDAQLTRFKARSDSRGRVLDTGLWRYTRHPNYFGECCVWWGFGLLALATGAWWALGGPLLMTILLLEVSGVALLEQDIEERRPDYAQYVRRTSAFFPWPPRA
ncbi:MAG: DUF1295 domain-containing protein [Planctomycetes bacterium]|nr:DUF1295 domain-containing protein [Planctomycetota bacterium]MCB9917989.1 DUF1295 domain-containing protein [Planctomycetota bacterium]